MKIFIDPGHGGNDPGAIGPSGTRESDVTLRVALALEKELTRLGITSELSRSTDVTVPLAARAEMANKTDADLLISIHCNGFLNSGAAGTEVYSFPGNTNGSRISAMLSNAISKNFGLKNRGAKTENFAVLRLSNMPAALIEMAFITNPSEEKLLTSPDFPEEMAKTIAASVSEYFGIKTPEPISVHWGNNHLESLINKGFINSPELWKNFDSSPSCAMVLALIDKITEEIK